MGEKAYFVCVPTSSGTGSEVTPFAVITDEKTGHKYPLADYELMPNMAIIDTDLMMSAPKGLTAASGLDCMVHDLEAYASVMATDFTDGIAVRSLQLTFANLRECVSNGQTAVKARENMAHAATMAGMAFANAFLGIAHSLAHKLGAYHHLPHGICCALVIENVMKFNANPVPTKMGTFSQYQYPHALERYADIARALGLTGKDDRELFEGLLGMIAKLKEDVGCKRTIAEYGITEEDFLATLDQMSEDAFDDQCTGANPRYPLISELKEIYLACYYGTEYNG
jgi:acetaldehyde dehydrogenase/alcohol dehydrogenase